jgi:hypothetical protein
MISPKQVTGVIVTRGNRDISAVLKTMECLGEVIVWDNSKRDHDLKVFGRFAAKYEAKNSVIFTVDDDAIVDVAAICAEYEPGTLVCNMKPGHHDAYRGTGIALIGHGSIFDARLADFNPYWAKYPGDQYAGGMSEVFMRECDRVFTWLNRDRQKWLALPIVDLPHASQPGCMWMESRHGDDLAEIKRRLASLEMVAA